MSAQPDQPAAPAASPPAKKIPIVVEDEWAHVLCCGALGPRADGPQKAERLPQSPAPQGGPDVQSA